MSTTAAYDDYLHVAVAVIRDKGGRILITRRAIDTDQGGLWEFPGGKLEDGETPYQTLVRELKEELGIDVLTAHRLFKIPHAYPEIKVLLDVWQVDVFQGKASSCEDQPLAWVTPDQLAERSFPAANHAIINAIVLPDRYLITPDSSQYSEEVFLQYLESSLQAGVRLVQYRDKMLPLKAYQARARAVIDLCNEYDAQVLLNADVDTVMMSGAQGIHLDSQRLWSMSDRPLVDTKWVAASCHNRDDLLQAARVGVDFVVLSPVKMTQSHPQAIPIGMSGLIHLLESVEFPVYALGGMSLSDLDEVVRSGAQGIAAISGLWMDGL